METNPKNIRLAPIVYGDTWDGLTDCQFTTDGTELDSNRASVTMVFSDSDNAVGLTLTSSNGITINNANEWRYTVNPILAFPLAIGVWYWAITCVSVDGRRKTRISGTKEVTR